VSAEPVGAGDDGGIRQRLRRELKARMVARDTLAVKVVRIALAAIENAEAQPVGTVDPIDRVDPVTGTEAHLASPAVTEVARLVVSEDDARRIVGVEIRDLDEAVERYRSLGRADAAAEVEAQRDVLRAVLGSAP
jgi:uncharacterized protein YqeY